METKCAIITGGGGELGKVVSAHFLDEGYSIAIPRYPVGHETGLAAPSPVVRVLERDADLTREEDVKEFVRAVEEAFGGITCLLNLAGAYAGGNRVEATSLDEWNRMISLNTTTAFLMARACITSMRAQGFGRIVNIAALPAIHPSAERAAYAVSKRGVVTAPAADTGTGEANFAATKGAAGQSASPRTTPYELASGKGRAPARSWSTCWIPGAQTSTP